MSRLRIAENASFWPGHYETVSRDIRGEATESWAAEERRQRTATGRHGVTELELRRLLGARVEYVAVPAHGRAA